MPRPFSTRVGGVLLERRCALVCQQLTPMSGSPSQALWVTGKRSPFLLPPPSLGWGPQDKVQVLERWKLELTKLQLRAGTGVDLTCTHSPQVVSDDGPQGNLIPQRRTPEDVGRRGRGRRPVK